MILSQPARNLIDWRVAWHLYGMFSRDCSLTASPSSLDFPQHLNTGLNLCLQTKPICFSAWQGLACTQFLLYRFWWLKPLSLIAATKNIINADLWSLSCSLALCFLLFYNLTCSFPGIARFPAPLSRSLLPLAGIPYFVLPHTHKSLPLREALPTSVPSFCSPLCGVLKNKKERN